jgi:hypothetical protein
LVWEYCRAVDATVSVYTVEFIAEIISSWRLFEWERALGVLMSFVRIREGVLSSCSSTYAVISWCDGKGLVKLTVMGCAVLAVMLLSLVCANATSGGCGCSVASLVGSLIGSVALEARPVSVALIVDGVIFILMVAVWYLIRILS